jgi:phage-related protein/DNA-binding XRE family transcriptional regulator
MPHWSVEIVEKAEAELDELPEDMQARFVHIAEMLEELGPARVGMPHVRHLVDDLWEMRMRGRDGIARAIYFSAKGRRVVVVWVFVKKLRRRLTEKSIWHTHEHRNSKMAKKLKDVKARLLAKPEVRAAYNDMAAEYDIARAVIQARVQAGLSQQELAERMGTTQPNIARLESGRSLPSVRTLQKVGEATGTRARFVLEPA